MSDYEIGGLDELEKTLLEMIEVKYPKELEKLLVQIAYELQGETKKVQDTKVRRITGRLINGWRVGKVKKKAGEYYIEIYNNVEYAEHVEYGHRNRGGGYYEGAHMLEISLKKLEKRLTPYLKGWLDNFIKEHGL